MSPAGAGDSRRSGCQAGVSRSIPELAGATRLNGSATAVGQLAGRRRVEHPDAGLERQQRPFALGVGPRGEGALPEKVAAGEAEHRFDAHVGVWDRRAGGVDDLAGQPIERLRRRGSPPRLPRRTRGNGRTPAVHEDLRYRASVMPWPWITIPGRSPVWRPSSSTTRPLTITVGMPTGY